MSDLAISVRSLRKTYDGIRYAVDGISFDVKRGEIFGLLGKNGAGKTTTIRMLTTLIKPTSGTIEVLGLDPQREPLEVRKRIGVVQQSESIDFTTVENCMKIYATLWEVPREVAKARTEELMELFDLNPLRKSRAFELSGGQKKRLQVARELLHDMDILFLDEPTVGMDPIMRRKVLDYIKRRAGEGLTVVFTTHFLDEADYLCDRISIMAGGKIVAQGKASELKVRYSGLRTLEVDAGSPVRDPAALREAIVSRGLAQDVSVDGSVVKVIGRNISRELDEVIRVLKANGVYPENITMREATLDDVFIQVVGVS
ncbi:ABC transporter [Thermogymnomonas acidicola]|uniref:ABC transporter n=1 Tax=Thermogymnomonas acidicola TaxID=399579 RepID=A0AA37BQN3_9ARCH|nr:ABC transporter ATP-binding protein [Thermogymnomonas acidicola]GGM70318.1 ABC transporter [Thermogymnomonas acidicola]